MFGVIFVNIINTSNSKKSFILAFDFPFCDIHFLCIKFCVYDFLRSILIGSQRVYPY